MLFQSGPEPEEIIGRIPERKMLGEIVDKARAGERKGVILLGPSGIGKTTLLRWTQDRATETGFMTAFVRAPKAAGLPPRFPVGEILEGLIAECSARGFEIPHPLRRVVDTLRGTPGVDPYPAQLPQIAQALEETAKYAPVGIFIDDYHWAPHEGVEVLVAAARVIDGPVLVAITAREEARAAQTALPESTADLWFDRVQVTGLLRGDVVAFLKSSLGAPPLPSLLQSITAHSEGNPLIARELVRFWIQTETVVKIGSFWGMDDPGETPASLNDIVARRLRSLEPPEQDIVHTLALWSRDVTFAELSKAVQLDQPTLITSLARLEQAAFLRVGPDPAPRYRLIHPSYEQAALLALDKTRAAVIHQRIFDALQDDPSVSISELAHHAVHSLEQPRGLDELLIRAAGEASRAGSYRDAAMWYGLLASRLTEGSSARHDALLQQAAAMTHFSPAQAVTAFDQLIGRQAHSHELVQLLQHRANAHRILGNPASALADLNLASTLASDSSRPALRHAVAVMHGILGDVDRAARELTLLENHPDAQLRAKALGHLGQVAFIRGNFQRADKLWQLASELSADEEYLRYLRSNLSWLRVLTGAWDRAKTDLETDIARAVSQGDAWNAQTLLCSLSRLLAWRGDVPDAIDAAATAQRLARQLQNPACVVAANDALALAFVELGDATQALSLFPEVNRLLERQLEPRELSLTLTIFAEAHLLAGDLERAEELSRDAERRLDSGAGMTVAVDRAAAQIMIARGNLTGAMERLGRWILAPSPFAFEQGRVHTLAAVARGGLRDREGSRSQAEAARDIFRKLGSTRRGEAADRWLTTAGGRSRGRPRARNSLGLTDREIDVVRLVAQGLSNRDVATALNISVATAKKHLENIHRKLGTSRRAELVRWRDTLPPRDEGRSQTDAG